MSNSDYTVYYGVEHLAKVSTSATLCFDTETLQLKPEPGKLRLLQFGSYAQKTIVLIDLFQTDEKGYKELDRFFQSPERTWIAHNTIFDLGWLATHSWVPQGTMRDTMLASRLLTNGLPNMRHGLADLAKRVLGVDVSKEQQTSDWSGHLTQEQLDYAAKDVELLCEMDIPVHTKIQQSGLYGAYNLECAALQPLALMENTGLPWDRAKLQDVEKDYQKDIENIEREFYLELDEALPEGHKLPRDPDGSFNLRKRDSGNKKLGTKKYAGFNIGSSKQFLDKLERILGYVPLSPVTGKPSTDKRTMEDNKGAHPVIATYSQWKRAEKRRQMVVSLLKHQDPDGFIRASYWQLGAETGRMTCSDPNLQQVPRDEQFRSAVVASEGWLLLDADFSQMELRLAARVANDENMMQAFRDGRTYTLRLRRPLVAIDRSQKAQILACCMARGQRDLVTTQLAWGSRFPKLRRPKSDRHGSPNTRVSRNGMKSWELYQMILTNWQSCASCKRKQLGHVLRSFLSTRCVSS